jgi:hypothetical protein
VAGAGRGDLINGITKELSLLGFELLQPRAFHKLIQILKRKYLSARCQYHLLHVFPADPEASARDAGDYLIFRFSFRLACHAQFAQMLDARHFIARRSVIFGDLRFDDDLRVELAQNNEVRGDLPLRPSFPRKRETRVLSSSGYRIKSGMTIRDI